MKIRELTLFAVLAAILFIGQAALAQLPNIEIVSLLVMAYACVFRWKSLICIYVFVFLEGALYGFGLWWISYLYIWTILAAFSIALDKTLGDNRWLWAIFAGLYGLAFGSLTALSSLFIGGPAFALAYIVSGLKFDLVHGLGNFVLTLLLFVKCKTLLGQLYTKIAA